MSHAGNRPYECALTPRAVWMREECYVVEEHREYDLLDGYDVRRCTNLIT
jgi:hypothetical protein